MNFLLIYMKNGDKHYLNITDIDSFSAKEDSISISFFSDSVPLTYTKDDYDKWELI